MAKILEFRALRDVGPKARRRKGRNSAEIVIFPGVRYERWTAEPKQGERKTPAMARDAMKVAE